MTFDLRPALESVHSPIQWVPGTLFLGVKWQGREADHSPPSCAVVRNAWNYTFTPQYIMAWCSVKRDNFTFTASSKDPFYSGTVSYIVSRTECLRRINSKADNV